MNRDGYDVSVAAAGHEAAHAVIAALSGPTAKIDIAAAGYAWELGTALDVGDLEDACHVVIADAAGYARDDFAAAVQRVMDRLLDATLEAAHAEVADLLLDTPAGTVSALDVARILLAHGLVPAFDESWRAA